MRTLLAVVFLVALVAVGFAQSWHNRTSTFFLHLKYGTQADYNDNLDTIDRAIQRVTPTTTTVTTTTVTTTT